MVTTAELTELDRADCLLLLASGTVGRVVFTDAAMPAAHPVTDRLDGDLARRRGQVTELGKLAQRYLDEGKYVPDEVTNDMVRARLAELAPGVALLENLRFDPGEEADDPAFVERLVAGQEAYVNDAFGVSPRAHASVVGPPALLPGAAGRLTTAAPSATAPARPARTSASGRRPGAARADPTAAARPASPR